MSYIPKAFDVYKHFKGNLYQIITMAEHSETGEQMVVYQALYGDYRVYTRPLLLFTGKVDKEKYPQAGQEYRFELQVPDMPKEQPAAVDSQELQLDPALLQFLDADTYEDRLNILTGLRHRITDDMITTMAISCDIEVEPGDLEERYEALRNCLLTLERYECNRLR